MYFNSSNRIKAPHWLLRVGLGVAVLLSIVGIPDGAPVAQTSYSLRIRSLGDSFAGLVEDPHTDAYLNPARVGDLRDRQIYMARLPRTSLGFYYPDNSGRLWYSSSVFPPENIPGTMKYDWPATFTPYTLGYITPLSGSTKLSFSLEMAADGRDELGSSDELLINTFVSDRGIDMETSSYGREHSLYHVVADAAIGTGNPESEGTRAGVRLRVSYDQMQFGEVRVNQRFIADFPNIEDMVLDYDYDREQGDYETTAAGLSFGLYRNTGFFAQAVLGGGVRRETLANNDFLRRIDDEDLDDNGVGRWGDLTPAYRVSDREYDASRSYDSIVFSGRLGLRWSDRVRSFHRLSWGQSSGDGNGINLQGYRDSEVVIKEQYTSVSYDLEGDATRFTTDHSVAYIDTIGGNLLVALGVHAGIQYEEFEEGGDGTGLLSTTEGTSSDTFDTAYSQCSSYTQEFWLLSLPLGVEWRFHRNVAWRFGSQVRATRLDEDGEISREIDLLEIRGIDENPSYQDIQQKITYNTSLYFSMGFGFTFRDRLSIDLLTAATTGSFNATYVSTAQVKFYF